MVRTLTSILALLLVHSAFGGLAHAQTGDSSAPPEAVVKELSKQWSTAIINKDAAILERIWAPDFVSVGPSGQRFTRAQEIAALKASKVPNCKYKTNAFNRNRLARRSIQNK